MKSSLALFAVLGLLPMAQAQTTPHTPPTPAMIAQHQVQRYTTLLTLKCQSSGASHHYLHHRSHRGAECKNH